MKIKRKIIKIDEELCNGCGQCVTGCAEGALEIINGKARLVAEKFCDGLGACIGDCPTGALKIIERVADDFDEEAVEEFLRAKKAQPSAPPSCPSALLRSFAPQQGSCQAANQPRSQVGGGSLLGHWPVQIRLVPVDAPFLEKCDLLIAADCAPVAYGAFHQDFIAGRVVMMGCPKFDDRQSYVEKFAAIFAARELSSITSVIMEVPCCAAMRSIINEAMRQAGKSIPLREVVLSTRGAVLEK